MRICNPFGAGHALGVNGGTLEGDRHRSNRESPMNFSLETRKPRRIQRCRRPGGRLSNSSRNCRQIEPSGPLRPRASFLPGCVWPAFLPPGPPAGLGYSLDQPGLPFGGKPSRVPTTLSGSAFRGKHFSLFETMAYGQADGWAVNRQAGRTGSRSSRRRFSLK